MKTRILKATIGLATLLLAAAPVTVTGNGVDLACADGASCKPQWMWVCDGRSKDFEHRCTLDRDDGDDFCENAEPTFPPVEEEGGGGQH